MEFMLLKTEKDVINLEVKLIFLWKTKRFLFLHNLLQFLVNFFTLEKGVTFVEIHFQNIFERCVIAVNYLFSNPMLKIHTQSLFPINARLSKKLPGKISKNFGPVKISLFLKKQDKGVGSP